jgi:hypothetical protein
MSAVATSKNTCHVAPPSTILVAPTPNRSIACLVSADAMSQIDVPAEKKLL